MRAKSIRSIRQSELSRAAFEAVIKSGLRGTTLERVGKIAGVSKGVVLHHFEDQSALLEAVFRRSNSVLSMSLAELLRHTKTPYERPGRSPMQTFQNRYTTEKSARLGSLYWQGSSQQKLSARSIN